MTPRTSLHRTSPHRAPSRRAVVPVRSARALTTARLNTSAGAFDAASSVMPVDPHQSILNIIGGAYVERWPEQEQRIILYTPVFTYEQRLTALTFTLWRLS